MTISELKQKLERFPDTHKVALYEDQNVEGLAIIDNASRPIIVDVIEIQPY